MAIAQAIGDTIEDSGRGEDGGSKKKGRAVPYLLMLPGLLWLSIFFLVPLVSLFLTSLQTPVIGGEVGEFEQTFNFANYVDVLTDKTYYVPLCAQRDISGTRDSAHALGEKAGAAGEETAARPAAGKSGEQGRHGQPGVHGLVCRAGSAAGRHGLKSRFVVL